MKTILVVEDQPGIRDLIRMSLELEEYEIHEAADGAAGLALARRVRPMLVLLDVMMPGELNGLDVCRALRGDDAFKRTRIVMLTARGQAADRQAGLDAGADEYLVKPFSPLALVSLVNKLTR